MQISLRVVFLAPNWKCFHIGSGNGLLLIRRYAITWPMLINTPDDNYEPNNKECF